MLAPSTQKNILSFLRMKEGRILIGVLLFVAIASPVMAIVFYREQYQAHKEAMADKNETIRLERIEKEIWKTDALKYKDDYVDEVKSHARELDSIKEMFKIVIAKNDKR